MKKAAMLASVITIAIRVLGPNRPAIMTKSYRRKTAGRLAVLALAVRRCLADIARRCRDAYVYRD